MKTKFLWIAFVASAAMIAQVKAQVVRRGGGGMHAGAAPHVTAAAPASARPTDYLCLANVIRSPKSGNRGHRPMSVLSG